jgi:hypothetical protein
MKPQNNGQSLTKTALNTQKFEVSVVPLKYILIVMVLVNNLGTAKLQEIVHKNGPKTQKR